MAVKIVAIRRLNPAPCQHFELTVNVDGTTRTVVIHREDVLRQLNDFEPGGYLGALVLAWLRYKLERGAKLEELVGQGVVN